MPVASFRNVWVWRWYESTVKLWLYTLSLKNGRCGRLVGFTEAQAKQIQARYPFLQPMVIEPGSYPGQLEPLQTVGSFSFLLARKDLPNGVAYSLAKAIHQAQPQMAQRLEQAKDTLPRNTFNAASDPNHIHPSVRRYLDELGLR